MIRVWGIACGLLLLAGCGQTGEGGSADQSGSQTQTSTLQRGSAELPLRVLMIPADGGTEEGTIADFQPIFAAITREYGLHFDLKVAQSYNAVVEGMVSEKVDVAWFGAVTYQEAKDRGAAQLLAVGVTDGDSVYYAGIFVQKKDGYAGLTDLQGKKVAFGDVNSTSSFNFPVAMLIEAGVDPILELGSVYLTGSHANALSALAAGKVDAACASFSSFEKAVSNGQIDPQQIVPLAKSEPIPYPPLAMHVKLDESLKQKLRDAFNHVHTAPGMTPDMVRGYGGKRVDRYDADYPEAAFDSAMRKLAAVSDELKAEMLKKAAER